MKITIEDKMSIGMRDLQKHRTLLLTLKSLLTYKNPKYIENEKWGYSNHDTPKYLYSFEIAKDKMLISRGALTKVIKHFAKHNVGTEIIDRTLVLPEVNFSHSKTVLREDQESFAGDLMKFDVGCGVAPTSFGKCHVKGTKILMFDGSLKNVEEIVKNDMVMGVNSTPRSVTNTVVGRDDLYKITPNYGNEFVVNGEHILSLQVTGINERKVNGWSSGDIVEMTVEDYLNLKVSHKYVLKLRRPEIINFCEKPIPVDPYIYGLWLADGHKNTSGFTVNDNAPEIFNAIHEFADVNGYNVREVVDTRKCSELFLSHPTHGINPFREYLLGTVSNGEKVIPDVFKINSVKVRRELLAGLLDGDGYLVKTDYKTIEIFSKNETLANDIKFIAQSLGLKCSYKITDTHYVKNGERHDTGIGYRMLISGPTHELPLRVRYKQPSKHETRTNHLLTGFKVSYHKVGAFHGFTLTDDKLYMTDDFIIHHNTVTALEIIRMIGQPALIILHTTVLQEQWIKEITNSKLFNMDKKDVGGVGGIFTGSKRRFGKINVCLYHSLTNQKHLDFFKDKVGIIIFDEGQKSAIDVVQLVVNNFRARYRYSISASFERKDGKSFLIYDTFGSVRVKAKDEASDSKILAKVHIVPTTYQDADYEDDKEYALMLANMAVDRERNVFICRRVLRQIKQDKLCVIFVERKAQALILARYLSKFKGAMLLGKTNWKEHSVEHVVAEYHKKGKKIPETKKILLKAITPNMLQLLKDYNADTAFETITKLCAQKELDYVIGTQKIEVGVNVRTFDWGIVTTPMGNNLERFNQALGRLERKYKDIEIDFFGHEKMIPVMEVLSDTLSVSRNASSNIKTKYGNRVVTIKTK